MRNRRFYPPAQWFRSRLWKLNRAPLSRILIGSAIVVALLIGAFAATFVYELRSEQQATADVTATEDSFPQSQPSLEGGVAAIQSHEPEPIVQVTGTPARRFR